MRRLIGLVATLAFVSIAATASAATPEKVLNQPGVDEVVPSASDGYLVWTSNSRARPGHYNSYVMPDGGARVRVNPVGTRSGSASIDGTTVVYQEDTREDGDIRFFDAVTKARTEPPAGVNTANYEFRPTLSGDWLLFSRTNVNRVPARNAWVKVVLFDLTGGTSTLLRKLAWRSYSLVSDQVNGDWATFESCRVRSGPGGEQFSNCQVFLYDISAGGAPAQVPNPGLQQYAGAVSADGTVYLVRQRNRNRWVCGSRTQLVRMDGGTGTVIASLPEGKDSFNAFAFDEPGGSTTWYFERFSCRSFISGIYRIPDADSTT